MGTELEREGITSRSQLYGKTTEEKYHGYGRLQAMSTPEFLGETQLQSKHTAHPSNT